MGKCDRCEIEMESEDELCPYCQQQSGGFNPFVVSILIVLIFSLIIGFIAQFVLNVSI